MVVYFEHQRLEYRVALGNDNDDNEREFIQRVVINKFRTR